MPPRPAPPDSSFPSATAAALSPAVQDPLITAYDRFAYRHGAIAPSHPARLGAIGRLLGLPAALPDRCRVLELGCAEGWNLLPLAERFPHSEFVGVDFAPGHIAAGE